MQLANFIKRGILGLVSDVGVCTLRNEGGEAYGYMVSFSGGSCPPTTYPPGRDGSIYTTIQSQKGGVRVFKSLPTVVGHLERAKIDTFTIYNELGHVREVDSDGQVMARPASQVEGF